MYDAGPVVLEAGGMGAMYRGLSWVEMMAWVEGAGMHDIEPVWRRRIKHMSGELAMEMNRANNADALAPYQPEERE